MGRYSILHRVLVYTLIITIVYLLLRLFSKKFDIKDAIIYALIFGIACMVIERIIVFTYSQFNKTRSPHNKVSSCLDCAVDIDNAPTNKKCRVVCEEIEGFERENKEEPNKKVTYPEYIKHTTENTDKEKVDKFYWKTLDGELVYDTRPKKMGMYYDTYNDYAYPPGYRRYYDGYADGNKENREHDDIERRRLALEDRAHDTSGYDYPYQSAGEKSQRDRTIENRRIIEGPLDDELPYSDYNHLPMAAGYKSHDYEYGYSFLPPEKWYPQPPVPPICVSEKRCPVYPGLAGGSKYADVKEWHDSRRITPPDMINIDYVADKLNSGR